MQAEIYLVSRTWFALVEGRTYSLTRQDLFTRLEPGRYDAEVRIVGSQADVISLPLRPENIRRAA